MMLPLSYPAQRGHQPNHDGGATPEYQLHPMTIEKIALQQIQPKSRQPRRVTGMRPLNSSAMTSKRLELPSAFQSGIFPK